MAEKGFYSLSYYNLVHKPIPIHQAMKIPDAKDAVDNEWNTLKTLPALGKKSQEQKRTSLNRP